MENGAKGWQKNTPKVTFGKNVSYDVLNLNPTICKQSLVAYSKNSRWRPKWPPRHIWSIISGNNSDRNMILVSRIGFCGSRYSTQIFLTFSDNHVFVLSLYNTNKTATLEPQYGTARATLCPKAQSR